VRVAVTGANGRLGRALVRALGDAPFTGPGGPIAWARVDFDLDAPDAIGDRLERDRPEVVVHAAAWTDVDGCERDPDRAMAVNAGGAANVAVAGVRVIHLSTDYVFSGNDPGEYAEDAPTGPLGAYGRS
jgi:dTDP-4-dehydrorhamnose reductase